MTTPCSEALALIDNLLKHFSNRYQTHNNPINRKMTQQISKIFSLSPLGRSALFMAAGRAIESHKPKNERLFYDPYAHLFADSMGSKYLKKMSKYAVSYIKYRTLYIDDHITTIVNKFKNEKIEIVCLGVGCDARSYRLESITNNPNITVYELDLMDVIQYRRSVLIEQNNAQSQCKVIPIAVDFRNNNWINELLNFGYDKRHCNIWIAEGLFPFLKRQEINSLFDNINQFCYTESSDHHHKHWMIGNFLNRNTMLQSKLNKLNKQRGDTTCKTGYKRPHKLLDQHGYNDWDIKPIGSLNKNIKTYQQYLDCVAQNDAQSQTDKSVHIKADHFAKSFMFCASK
eukprot:122832_1